MTATLTPEESVALQASLDENRTLLATKTQELADAQKVATEAGATVAQCLTAIKELNKLMNGEALKLAEHYRTLAGRKPRTPRKPTETGESATEGTGFTDPTVEGEQPATNDAAAPDGAAEGDATARPRRGRRAAQDAGAEAPSE